MKEFWLNILLACTTAYSAKRQWNMLGVVGD